MKINPEAVLLGIEDALSKSDPQLNPVEMDRILRALKKNIVDSQKTDRQLEKQKNKETYRREGREFLMQNVRKEGVVALPSGLQYKIIKEGSGKMPGPHDRVRVYYRSTLANGIEFDSSGSDKQPAEFRVDGVVPGWTEALQLMKEGARWQLFVPADLAYGERGPLADRTVLFDIELISVLPAQETENE